MKKVQKGFTLVELIVVITILAILGTIAFISLQGYSQDARDSKVVSDIRSLTSAIETQVTQEAVSIHSFNNADVTNNFITGVADNSTPYSGTGVFAGTVTLTGASIKVGTINFTALKQNGADFGASTYKIATLTHATGGTSYSMYQIVGAKGITGAQTAVVKGNFLKGTGADAITGLIAGSGSLASPLGLEEGANLPDGL